jgi:hypothetical protein
MIVPTVAKEVIQVSTALWIIGALVATYLLVRFARSKPFRQAVQEGRAQAQAEVALTRQEINRGRARLLLGSLDYAMTLDQDTRVLLIQAMLQTAELPSIVPEDIHDLGNLRIKLNNLAQ